MRRHNLTALLVSSYRKGRQRAIKSAPCEVKIASRRRRRISTVFGLVLGGLHLPAIGDGPGAQHGTPTVCRTPCHADPHSHVRDKPSLKGFGARSVRRGIPTDEGSNSSPAPQNKEPDESFNGRCTQPTTLRNTSHSNRGHQCHVEKRS